jgi:hypothetical protein
MRQRRDVFGVEDVGDSCHGKAGISILARMAGLSN